MGLILPQTIKVKITPRNHRYLKEKGYEFEKFGDIIEVNVLDLKDESTVWLNVLVIFAEKLQKRGIVPLLILIKKMN